MKIEDELKAHFRNEHHKLMVNLMLTSTRLGERFQAILKDHDITSTQYNVLRILRGQNREAVSISLIKERMIERNSDVSRIIERLLHKGWIERSENAEDRRQKDVRISYKGLGLLNKIDPCEKQMDAELQYLSEKDTRKLNNLLDQLRSIINT